MAKRTIVSYNDLYDEFGDDLIAAPASAPATVSAPGRVLSTITVSGGNDDSCTSESEGEGQGVVGMNGDWDDSDLIRAWDSTISSYRQQHALLMEDKSYRAEQHASESIVGQWSSVESGVGGKRKRRHQPPVKRHDPVVERQDLVAQEPAADVAGFTGFGLPTSEDDALSKLNMAWYYAGYYAGCYQAFRSGIGGPASASASASAATATPRHSAANGANGSVSGNANSQARKQGRRDAGSPEPTVE